MKPYWDYPPGHLWPDSDPYHTTSMYAIERLSDEQLIGEVVAGAYLETGTNLTYGIRIPTRHVPQEEIRGRT